MLSASRLALQERLLAKCRAQDNGGVGLRQREEPPEQGIHRPISEQDRIAIGLYLVFRLLQRKRIGVHVTPICMLQMSGAIDEEGREIRAHSAIIVTKQIELQTIGESYSPPLDISLRKPLAAELGQDRSNRVRPETAADQKRHERQQLVYGQCNAPRVLLHQFGHYGLEQLDFARPGGLVAAPWIG